MLIIILKNKFLNEVKMYLMNFLIYFSVKGWEFLVFLYLYFFFNVEKKIGSLD